MLLHLFIGIRIGMMLTAGGRGGSGGGGDTSGYSLDFSKPKNSFYL